MGIAAGQTPPTPLHDAHCANFWPHTDSLHPNREITHRI